MVFGSEIIKLPAYFTTRNPSGQSDRGLRRQFETKSFLFHFLNYLVQQNVCAVLAYNI